MLMRAMWQKLQLIIPNLKVSTFTCHFNKQMMQSWGITGAQRGHYSGTTRALLRHYWGTTGALLGYFWGTFWGLLG